MRGDVSWPANHSCDGCDVPGEVLGLGPGRIDPDVSGPRLTDEQGRIADVIRATRPLRPSRSHTTWHIMAGEIAAAIQFPLDGSGLYTQFKNRCGIDD